MIWFLIVADGFWGLGHLMKAPRTARWGMIAILYLAVLLALVTLPDNNGLRNSLGGSFGEWLLLGGFAVLIWGIWPWEACWGRVSQCRWGTSYGVRSVRWVAR